MMKKAMMAIVAAMMSATMMAQSNEQPQMPQQPVMDKAEMAKQRTEQMVKDYGLSEEQAAQLLTLNTEFADKVPMMGRGPRGGMQRMQPGQMRPRDGEARPQNGEARPQRPDTLHQRRPMGERPAFDREAMRKVMEDYNEGVKKIFTEEQFKKYQDNQQHRRPMMGQRGRRGPGQRPQQQ